MISVKVTDEQGRTMTRISCKDRESAIRVKASYRGSGLTASIREIPLSR
jgi:hypothetical protein